MILKQYIPYDVNDKLPALYKSTESEEKTFHSEREILYQILFDMKKDMNDLKKLVHDIIDDDDFDMNKIEKDKARILNTIPTEAKDVSLSRIMRNEEPIQYDNESKNDYIQDTEVYVEESLSLVDKEIELIKKALEKHSGKRTYAAQELGISERTLYRKIKEYEIDL